MTRDFRIALPTDVLQGVQTGTLRYEYRGRPMLKNPFDLAIYLRLVGRLRPRTVVEIGARAGGSALWFADMMAVHGIDGRVVSVDLEPPDLDDPRIRFLRGDALDLGATLTDERLGSLAQPLLVVEDSAHLYETTLAVLRFFDERLEPGEYLVVEDGVVAQLPQCARFEDGPNRAVARFLEERAGRWEIDTDCCDTFGRNVTWNPNGYLRRAR